MLRCGATVQRGLILGFALACRCFGRLTGLPTARINGRGRQRDAQHPRSGDIFAVVIADESKGMVNVDSY
jgi:hypothetical protein